MAAIGAWVSESFKGGTAALNSRISSDLDEYTPAQYAPIAYHFVEKYFVGGKIGRAHV